jgi:tRNA(fMet)-specific endonuclease VapC
MSTVLLDTGVASFLHPKRRHSPQRALYVPHLTGHVLAVSFQSAAEIYQWAEERHWGANQRAALDRFLSRFLVIPYDIELGRVWARVMTQARAQGRRLEAGDGWIAAAAVRHRIPLVTHDADFVNLRLTDLNVISYATGH